MPRDLSSTQVAALQEDGDFRVARCLYMQLRDGGRTKSWVIRYRFGGRLKRMGIGPYRLVNFKQAQAAAIDAQQLLLRGVDPMAARDAAKPKATITFERATEEYIKAFKAGWSHPKHASQVTAHMRNYAFPTLKDRPVDHIDTNDVVKILQPIWETKHETATRVRARIEAILDWATAAKHRTGDNPAAWSILQYRLPSTASVAKVEHFAAVPHEVAPKVFKALQRVDTTVSKALQFIALTAMRPGAVLGAKWGEFDLTAQLPVWTVPAGRMKGRGTHRREFRVPLSPTAVALVQSLRPEGAKPDWCVFKGLTRLRPVSDTALRVLLRKVCDVPDVTSHGWRTTFRTWCADKTAVPREVAEMALAHTVGSKVERAYQRSDLFDVRVPVMAGWATYLSAV